MYIPITSVISSRVHCVLLMFTILSIAACSGSKSASNTFRSPTYVKKNYQQLVVYARIEQDGYRQRLENAIVSVLEQHGYHAIPAYKNFDVVYKTDSVKFMNRINELKVDGVVAVAYLGKQTTVQDSYRYNGGMYNYFASGAAPFDLETSAQQTGYFRLDFYNLDSRASQYNTVVPIRLSSGIEGAVKQFSEETYTALKGDRII